MSSQGCGGLSWRVRISVTLTAVALFAARDGRVVDDLNAADADLLVETALAPFAAADYAVEVKAAEAARATAFRVVP